MPVARDVFDRLFEKTAVQDNGCWIFTGRCNMHGYGTISFENKPVLAHRMAYILCIDDIPSEMNVLHTCDNPPCVNPDHLFLGTQQINVADMVSKGRNFIPSLDNNPNAKLSLKEVKEIKELLYTSVKQIDIAVKYRVSKQTISEIARGNLWKDMRGINDDTL